MAQYPLAAYSFLLTHQSCKCKLSSNKYLIIRRSLVYHQWRILFISAYIAGHSVSKLLDSWPEGTAKKAFVGMRSLYKTVITHLQKKLPIGDSLLRALTCLNPREQSYQDTLQNCKVVAEKCPALGQKGDYSWRWVVKVSRNETKMMKWNLEVTTFGTKYSARLMSVVINLKLCLKWWNVCYYLSTQMLMTKGPWALTRGC